MSTETRYSVTVVAEGANEPWKRFVVSNRRIRRQAILVGVGLLLLVSLPAIVVGVVYGRRAADQRAENLALSQRLESLDQRIVEAEDALARVQDYDTKIRKLTQADEGVRPFGIGPLQDLELETLLEESRQATLPDGAALSGIETGAEGYLESRLDGLATAIDAEEVSLQDVRGYLVNREGLLHAYPTAWPADGWVTSRYGWRRSPLPGAQTFHTGVDVAASYGTPIRAAGDGVVISSAYREAYGYTVEIDHGYGLGTLYAHNSRLLVREGDQVKRGDVIARMGSTGRATGPHLHFEVHRDGVPVNPALYLIDELTVPLDD